MTQSYSAAFSRDQTNFLAFCKACGKPLKASSGKADLYSHSNTEAHKKNVIGIQLQPSAIDIIEKNEKIDRKVNNAKIKTAIL